MSSKPQLEEQALLYLARPDWRQEGDVALKALLSGKPNWQRIGVLGQQHKVLPLLFWNLQTHFPDAAPLWFRDRLQSFFDDNARRALLMSRELHHLSSALAASGITSVPFKGPLLAELAFGNLALRQSGDLDILVPKKDVGHAKKVAIEQGYRPSVLRVPGRKRMLDPVGPTEKAYLRSHYHYVLFHQQSGIRLELHWAFNPRHYFAPLEQEEVWGRTVRLKIAGQERQMLCMEDMILALCAHGTRHQWEQLRWISDLAGLLRPVNDIDWRSVLAHARALGGERMVLLALCCAQKFLGAELPSNVADRIEQDPMAWRLADQLRNQWFQEPRASEALPQPLLSQFQIKSRERLDDKIRFCSRFITTPTVNDWDSSHLPRLSSGFYYIVRPLRLSAKYLSRSLKRFVSRPELTS